MKIYIFFLIVLNLFFLGCTTLKIDNSTNCHLDVVGLSTRLLKNDKRIKKVKFGITTADLSLTKNCEGFYFLYVSKWEGVKNNFNFIQIPVIISKDSYYINMDFINGREIKENNLNNELLKIRNELLENFDEITVNKILERFKYGVVDEYKAHFF